MKKIISVLLVLSFCLSLVACSGKDSSGNSESSSSNNSSSTSLEQESSEIESEPAAVGSMTIDEAVEANLRAYWDMGVYLQEDGSLYFKSHDELKSLLDFCLQAQKGLHSIKVKSIAPGGIGELQIVTEDGEYCIHMEQIFEDYDMERVIHTLHTDSSDLWYGLTTDGKVIVCDETSLSEGDWFTKEIPEFGNGKYIFNFENILATVNRDGTVTLFELDNVGSVEDDVIANVSDWTDIAYLALGYDMTNNANFAVGLKNDGSIVCTDNCSIKDEAESWTDMVYLDCNDGILYGLTSNGSVRAQTTRDKEEDPVAQEFLDWKGVKVLCIEDSNVGNAITFDDQLLGCARELVYRYKPGEPLPEDIGWTGETLLPDINWRTVDSDLTEKFLVDGVKGGKGTLTEVEGGVFIQGRYIDHLAL